MTIAVPPDAAGRLLAELMPIAITVAGTGADAFARDLASHGADAEVFSSASQPGFDLAILLAQTASPQPGTAVLVNALASISERLLFVPAPAAPPNTDAWFEVLAEAGYQPVVDYDAGFLGQGAFLVDRNATAAEDELAAFSERVSGVPAVAAPVAAQVAAPAEDGRAALHAELAAVKAALAEAQASQQAESAAAAAREAALRTQLEAADAEALAARRDAEAWQGLRVWIAKVTARPSHNSAAALRGAIGAPRGPWLRRLFRLGRKPTAEEARILADMASLRQCPLFDAAWYIASNPSVAQSGIDPVLHYLLTGAAMGAEPGPWFDTPSYRARHPRLQGNPLLHAIATGEVAGLMQAAKGQ